MNTDNNQYKEQVLSSLTILQKCIIYIIILSYHIIQVN